MFALRVAVTLCVLVKTDGLKNVPMYASDFSEHCLRRDALPSVFLAKRAMTATSQVLYFSKLDRPYSCYASIRTEASHSIVMVLQLDWNELEKNCQDGQQLAVYEFPETYGGYWGPIPGVLLERNPDKPVYTKQYTLRTEKLTTETTTTTTTTPSTTTTTTTTASTTETQGFLDIEVPLVNISAALVPSNKTGVGNPFDIDDFFDIFYNVAPSPGEEYKTSLLPLLQVAVEKQDARREGGEGVDAGDKAGGGEPLFQLEYEIGPFTPDHRLKIHEWPKKNNTNRNKNRWKKKKLQDKRVDSRINNVHTRTPSTPRLKQYTLPPASDWQSSYKHVLPKVITEKKNERTTVEYKEVFNVIDDIMKNLNETGELKKQEQSTHSDVLAILNMSEDTDHSTSVYLAPYPTYTFLPVSNVSINFTKNDFDVPLRGISSNILSMSSQVDQVSYTTTKAKFEYTSNSPQHSDDIPENIFAKKVKEDITTSVMDIEKTETPFDIQPVTHKTTAITSPKSEANRNIFTSIYKTQEEHSRITDQVANDVLFSMSTTDKENLSGTLVDHESWENVVQSAPVMAGLLSKHGSELDNSTRFNASDVPGAAGKDNRRVRRKRNIVAIDIDHALPRRRMSTNKPFSKPQTYGPGDMVEFARMLELPEDEMSNRVIVNLGSNSSTKLFDMCDPMMESKTRILMLFNSSRILISIVNFTITSAEMVLTAGVPIIGRPDCPSSMVECQVEGVRLCIDATNACDSLPNCGSLSAYDEDRVLCGFIRQDRNVFMAAVTLLIMFSTALYIVYYWLKRCVPNVADAFFVYYDSAENQLFLDSIMRSPTEFDNGTNYMYDSFFETQELSYDRKKSTNLFKRMLSYLPNIRLVKQKRLSSEMLPDDDMRKSFSLRKKTYSFAETEIRNFMHIDKVDRHVQTGASLEMAYLKNMNAFRRDMSDSQLLDDRRRHSIRPPVPLPQPLRGSRRLRSLDEISDQPGPSERSEVRNYARVDKPIVEEEEEIQNVFYDPAAFNRGISRATGPTDRNQVIKSLRFNEHKTYIPRDDEDELEMEVLPFNERRHSTVYEGWTSKSSHKKSDDKQSDRTSDFRNFFKKKRGPK